MRIGAAKLRTRLSGLVFALSLLCAAGVSSPGTAAEKAEQSAPESKESFNLILPFKDLTVGQGQEVTMDTEVVNRRKDPVEVSITLEGVPKGWDVNFNSRYPSYPVRSVMVAGEKSTTIELKGKIPEATKPGNYEIKVTAKDTAGSTQYVSVLNFRVTSKKVETGGLKLSSQYPVLGTGTGQTLKFTVDLKNETNKPLTTSLAAQAPPGWTVRFKPQFGDQQISSIQIKESGSETLSVEIDTPSRADAKEHPVAITARSGAYEASTKVNVTLKGTQDLKMASLAGTLDA